MLGNINGIDILSATDSSGNVQAVGTASIVLSMLLTPMSMYKGRDPGTKKVSYVIQSFIELGLSI